MKLQQLFAVLISLAIAGPAVSASGEVNLYSARKEALIKPLLDRFSAKTGIKVNMVTGKADALLKRLQSEGRNSPADLFITTDAGRLHRAKVAGVLQPVEAAALNSVVPAQYRDPAGYWFGLSLRARPIMYVKGRINSADLSTYEDLADPKWKGRICIRSSGNIYNQSMVASMIAAIGETRTEQWAKGFVRNFARPPKGGDRDQIKAAAAGQCDIAIANTYYFGQMLEGKKADQKAAAQKMAIFWPNQANRGVHVNISGAGIIRSAKNKTNAIKLLEFLVTDEAQEWYAQVNNEYPVRSNIKTKALLKEWGDFRSDSMNLSLLGEYNSAAVKLMDRVGWK